MGKQAAIIAALKAKAVEIAEELAASDPANAEAYRRRAKTYNPVNERLGRKRRKLNG